MRFTGIYAITDDKLLAPEHLLHKVEAALAAGVNLLQYRSKAGSNSDKHHTASALQALCNTYSVPLLINDDVELCLAVGAAGVHLGRQDTSLRAARQRLGADSIIGVTCHDSLHAAQLAEQAGADYVAFGRFFPSFTKPLATRANLSLLTQARSELTVPIVAIGGINAENGAAVRQAGADMLAVVHAIWGNHDIASSVRKLVQLYQ